MQIPIASIQPHPLNESIYGEITEEEVSDLIQSIEDVGLLEPIVINSRNQCISGHRRLQACRFSGMDAIECTVKEFSEDDAVLFIIEWNRQRRKTYRQLLNEAKSLMTYYGKKRKRGRPALQLNRTDELKHRKTTDVVAEKLDANRNTIYRLLFIDKHFPDLIDDLGTKITLNQAYIQVKTFLNRKTIQSSRNGSRKNLNRDEGASYAIYNKSSKSMDELDDGIVQCIVTSPPYWQQRDYGGLKDEIGREDDVDDYLDNILEVTAECHRILSPKGCMFLVMGDKFHDGCLKLVGHRLAIRMMDEQGWVLRNDLIWNKMNLKPENLNNRYSVGHEDVFFLVKSKRYQFNIDDIRIPYREKDLLSRAPKHHRLNGTSIGIQTATLKNPLGKVPVDVIDFPRNEPPPYTETSVKHEASFPVGLIERFIRASTNPGDVVVDPFAGSSSTGIAAAESACYFVGYETNRKFIRLSNERLSRLEK